MAKIKIIPLIGEFPSEDKDLTERLKRLPKNASLSLVFREISRWEEDTVRKFRMMEKTKKSGKIDGECCRKELQRAKTCSFLFL